ncbi:MAG: hypothetical protein ACKO3U_05375 [Actinomycetota bacterium]
MRAVRWPRGLVALFSVFALFLGSALATSADEGHRLMIVDAFSEGVSSGSEIYAVPEEQVQKILKNEPNEIQSVRKFCQSLSSPECAAQTGLSLRIYLPQCTQTVVHYCIETLAISPSSEAPLQAGSFFGYTTARTYPADVTRGIPESATTSRWKVPGVLNKAGTDTYAVKVLLDGFLSATSNSLYVFQVSALIEPYEEKSGSANTDSSCTSWQSGTACGVRKDFVEGQKAQLSVRLPNSITGWLHGRLKGAAISVEKFDNSQNKVTVTAENVRVPELNTLFTDAQVDALANPSFFRPNGRKWDSVNAGNPVSLEWVKQLAKPLNDRATGEHTTWSFSTIPSNRGNNKCFEDKTQLLGVVMTNSLVYAPSAPDFDGSQLSYQVGGLHFQPDGKTPNLGTYDLLIKSATARCLYNFTDAPLSATVSVTYADGGEQKITTTTLTEKNGWLHLGAYGFTFSSPVLRVKLSGVPQSLPKTSNNPSASSAKSSASTKNSSPTKNYTMTCVKGKITKKVISPKPMCPTGWKKKK